MRYRAVLSYLGHGFVGWQRQPKGLSIQSVVESALSQINGAPVVVVASGRTDSGVHALGQVVHFDLTNERLNAEKILNALNGLLPRSVRVRRCEVTRADFHAQRDATQKQYSYFYQQGPAALAPVMATSVWIRHALDIDAMNHAIGALVGTHDFLAFQASGAPKGRSTVRTVFEASVTREFLPSYYESDLDAEGFFMVRIRLRGNGFLKQMVRGIAGTLLQIGEGTRKPIEMIEVLREKRRSLVGPTAPGRGLFLEKVWYPD